MDFKLSLFPSKAGGACSWRARCISRPVSRHLSVGSSCGWTRELFPPTVLPRWLCRSFRKVSHRLTQILTGHGCFDVPALNLPCLVTPLYLLRGTWRGQTGSEDSVAHTLVDCAAFDGEWAAFVKQIGHLSNFHTKSHSLKCRYAKIDFVNTIYTTHTCKILQTKSIEH